MRHISKLKTSLFPVLVLCLAFLCPPRVSAAVSPVAVETDITGAVQLTQNDIVIARIVPWVFTKDWKLHTFTTAYQRGAFELACFLEDGVIDLEASTEIRDDGLHVHYKMTPRKTVQVLNVQAFTALPYADWEGAPYHLGGDSGKVPSGPMPGYVITQKPDQLLTLGPTPAHGGLTLALSAPGLQTLLQDNRKWSPDLAVLLNHHESSQAPWDWKAGESKTFDFVLSLNRPLVLFPADPPFPTKGFEGTWQGTMVLENWGSSRAGLVIDRGLKGHYAVNYTNFDYGIFGFPLQDVSVRGKTLQGNFSDGSRLEIRLGRLAKALEAKYSPNGEKGYSVQYTPGRDDFIPRVGADGRAVTAYQYQVPPALGDGWESADLRQSGADLNKLEGGIDRLLAGDYPHLDGVLAVQHGKIVLEEYFYGHGPGDEHELRSITKSVLATLFGIARDQGLVDLHDKLYDYFPEYRVKEGWDPRKDRITLEQMLTMTSGFDGEDGDTYRVLEDMFKTDDWLSFCLGLKLVNNPGEHYAYSSSSLIPLGEVLHRKSSLGIPEFAQKFLYGPLGITTHHWISDKKGTADVEGTFWLKPRDLAKLGLLMLHKGDWKGKQIVSSDWVERMTGQKIEPRRIGGDSGYGYLWWTWALPLHGQNYPVFYGSGRGGQNLFVVPGLDLVAVVTASNYYDHSYSNDSTNFILKYLVPSLKF